MKKFAPLLALICLGLVGCSGGDSGTTKKDEENFRNPPKEIPPASLKAMNEAREKGMKMAAEAAKKRAEGQNGGN